MLESAGVVGDLDAGRQRARQALESGGAWLKFLAMVEAQGGERASVESADRLARAPVRSLAKASRAGRVTAVDTFGLGELAVSIGAGRRAKEDEVDPRVGLMIHARLGAEVRAGDTLAEVHLSAEDSGVVARAAACFTVGDGAATMPALILERLG